MPGLRYTLKMIRRHRAQLGRQLGPPTGTELVGVQLGSQPGRFPGRENASRLRYGEGGLLDEDIAEPRQALRRDERDHLVDQELDVILASIAEFRGNDVGAEEGRDDPGGTFLSPAGDRPGAGGARSRGRGRSRSCTRRW